MFFSVRTSRYSPSLPLRSLAPGVPPSRPLSAPGAWVGVRLSPISAEGDLSRRLRCALGLSLGCADASPNLNGDKGRDWEIDRLCSWEDEGKLVAGESGRRKEDDMAGGAAAPDEKAGGVGAACKEGSVMEPRRWFWRNSRGARGVTGVCRELMDGDDVLGWKAVPAEVALGESADILWPERAGEPSADVGDVEDVGRRAAGAGTVRGAVSKYDNMDVQRQERVATILDNHVGQNYRQRSKRVTLLDTNHVPSPTALSASASTPWNSTAISTIAALSWLPERAASSSCPPSHATPSQNAPHQDGASTPPRSARPRDVSTARERRRVPSLRLAGLIERSTRSPHG